MRLVVIESPYSGDVEKHVNYLRLCMHDCFMRGEAPFASHGLYTQPGVLRDDVPEERALGIQAGFWWGKHASAVVVYEDYGISPGMAIGIEKGNLEGKIVEYRRLHTRDQHASTEIPNL